MLLINGIVTAAGLSLASYGWTAVSPWSFRLGLLLCAVPVGWLAARLARGGESPRVLRRLG